MRLFSKTELALGNLLFDANRFAEAESYFRQAVRTPSKRILI